jgi:hypothetical protein
MIKRSVESLIAHPDSKESMGKEPKKAEFTFVLCEHTLQNVEAIAKALEACDIIALEWIGVSSERERKEIETALTIITAQEATEEDKKWAHKILSDYKNDFYEAIVFLETITNAFEKSGKIIKLLDMTSDNPDFHLVEEYNASSHAIDTSIQGLEPNAKIKEKIKEHILLLASSSTIRETLMTKQLKLLAEQNAHAKIGVILGASHIAVFNDISQEMPAKPVFVGVGTEWVSGNLGVRYSYAEKAAHAIQNGIDSEPDPDLVDRSLLEEIIEYTSFTRVKKLSDNTESPAVADYSSKTESIQPQIIDRLTPGEAIVLLEAIDKIKDVDRSKQHPLFAKIQVNNEIYMLLREVQDKYF